MKIPIETYRGWEISFDTDKETFHSVSTDFDTEKSKTSYSACKKFIDDYIKENQLFKPFWVEKNPNSYGNVRKLRVVGIRKDGRFICELESGTKDQISDYDLDSWIMVNPDNQVFWDELKAAESESEAINQKIKEIKSKFIVKSLKQFKREINQ